MTAHPQEDSVLLSKDQLKLRQAIAQTWQLCKQGQTYLSSLSAQSALIYGGVLLLLQGIFGYSSIEYLSEMTQKYSSEELTQHMGPLAVTIAALRSGLDWLFSALLQSSMIVYLYRRFIENDQHKGEIVDLRFTGREWKVFMVSMVSTTLFSVILKIIQQILLYLLQEEGLVYDTKHIMEMLPLVLAFTVNCYLTLRLMVSPLLAATEPKKSFQRSWKMTKKRFWFFAFFVALLSIPSILVGLTTILIAKLTELINHQGISFGIFLTFRIIEFLLGFIPLYMGFITVYKNIKGTTSAAEQSLQDSETEPVL